MVVAVNVGCEVPVRVGRGVVTGDVGGMEAMNFSVAARFADSAVCAMIVGRNSGGIGVGMALDTLGVHPAKNPRREAKKSRWRFI
jgi:hypothetical protein